MDSGLKNKIAIVTGGAAGIGKATVELLAEEGAVPVFIDNNKRAGERLSKNLNKENKFICGDLRDEKFCKQAVEKTIKDYKRLNILINNAGRNDFLEIDNTSPQKFRESLEENLVQYYSMTYYSWPHLKKSKGNIVFVGSKVAVVGEGKTIAYAAAKGAINSLTRELATKAVNEKLGIRVNCVLPGVVATPQHQAYIKKTYGDLKRGNQIFGQRIPLGNRPTTPREVANEIIFLASKLASHTTGQLRFPEGGYVHLDRQVTGKYD